MALISPFSTCAICGEGLDRPYTATSGVAFPLDHRLSEYCDAPLHWDCLASWEDRIEFSRGYFVGSLHSHWSGSGTLLRATPDWLLACGPVVPNGGPGPARPLYAHVWLADWPLSLYSGWSEWTEYVDGGYGKKFYGPALSSVQRVIAEVRAAVPTLEALERLHAERAAHQQDRRSLVEFGEYLATLWGSVAYETDWQTLELLRQVSETVREQERRRAADALAQSNARARRLADDLAGGRPLACPHCQRRATDMRFFDLAPRRSSYFVCRACGRSFAPPDVPDAG